MTYTDLSFHLFYEKKIGNLTIRLYRVDNDEDGVPGVPVDQFEIFSWDRVNWMAWTGDLVCNSKATKSWRKEFARQYTALKKGKEMYDGRYRCA